MVVLVAQVLRIMTQIREIENDLIADVFAAADTDDTNGLSVEEMSHVLELASDSFVRLKQTDLRRSVLNVWTTAASRLPASNRSLP